MKGRAQVIRPWGEGWQIWRKEAKEESWRLVPAEAASAGRQAGQTVCGIPARLVVAAPLWIETVEESTIGEIVRLEVEMKGLAAGERLAQDLAFEVLCREEARVLVRAMVFPAEWPGEFFFPAAEAYEPGPLLAALQDNTLHLWREFDDLVAVVVWNGSVVCWETTSFQDELGEIETWLRCLMTQVASLIALPDDFAIKDWAGVLRNLPAGFSRTCFLSDSDRNEGPAMAATPPRLGWLPAAQREARKAGHSRRMLVRGLAAAAALAVLAMLPVLVSTVWTNMKIRGVEEKIAKLDGRISPLRDIAARWMRVEAAVDDRFFPLEVLHAVVSSIPSGGVRLTVFEMSLDKLLVEGEATNVSTATEFFNKLRENQEAPDISWEMPPVSVKANNVAHFVITGDRRDEE